MRRKVVPLIAVCLQDVPGLLGVLLESHTGLDDVHVMVDCHMSEIGLLPWTYS